METRQTFADDRFHLLRLGMLGALAIEIAILITLFVLLRQSWGDEAIGVGVFVLGLMLPSAIAQRYLTGLQRMPARKGALVLLAIGFGFGIGLAIVGYFAGPHGTAPAMMTGLAVQAVLHSLAIKGFRRAVRERGV